MTLTRRCSTLLLGLVVGNFWYQAAFGGSDWLWLALDRSFFQATFFAAICVSERFNP